MPQWIHDEIRKLLKQVIVDPAIAPGASVSIGRRTGGKWHFAFGTAGRLSLRTDRLVHPETIYDLASLTKPCVAVLAARLVAQGVLGWDVALDQWYPTARATQSSAATLEQLLSHRAGLEAHIVLNPLDSSPKPCRLAAIVRAANSRREECRQAAAADCAPVYSDLGYILAGLGVEEVLGCSLQEALRREVFEPLGIELGSVEQHCSRMGRDKFLREVAPTEVLEHRGGVIRGAVHDDNAWFLRNEKVCGHAGLFGTAMGVARFGAAVMDSLAGRREEWLPAEMAQVLVKARDGGSLRAGFDGKSMQGSSAGPAFGEGAFGHLGFTGTSLWCDPAAQAVVVLLTNRVNPSRDNIEIRRVRPSLHSSLLKLALRLTSRST